MKQINISVLAHERLKQLKEQHGGTLGDIVKALLVLEHYASKILNLEWALETGFHDFETIFEEKEETHE